MLLISFVAASIYFGIALFLSRGIFVKLRRSNRLPTISIVVPARNEEKNLPVLLDSLLKADYPKELLEIVIVNDQSEDRTREIAEGYKSKFSCTYKVVDTDPAKDPTLRTKTLTLTQGIDHATGELILMTDADCDIPPTWVRTMNSYFADDVGMVCGVTVPKIDLPPGFPWTWLEIVDWSFLLGTCSAFSGIGSPQGLIGNNYSIRKKTYEDIGTFRAHEYHTADDMTLLAAVKNHGRWKIVSPADNGLCARTLPMRSVPEQLSQRRRWIMGGSKISIPGITVLTYGMIFHLIWPLFFILLGVQGFLPFAVLLLGTSIISLPMLSRLHELRTAIFLPVYLLYTLGYGWLVFLYLLSGKQVMWKSRPA